MIQARRNFRKIPVRFLSQKTVRRGTDRVQITRQRMWNCQI